MKTQITRREFLEHAVMAGGTLALSGCASVSARAASSRPNVLWLTAEDVSAYEFGPYGNRDARTPNVEALARRGVTFTHAYSTGTQCSPARSSIITGAYATTYGMDYHRGKVPVPDGIWFPELLRASGYFCTNCRKTDYNAATATDGAEHWDACDGMDGLSPGQPQKTGTATYENPRRRPDQPFFAVFNYFGTHMTCVRTRRMEARQHTPGQGPDPARVGLPPHVPDLPEVRSDYARHLEAIEGMDRWLGAHLQNLKRLGLEDDTIVFFFGDNGGCLPRGKGFVFDTGLRVPMIVSVPPKWRHLLDLSPGSRSDRLVSFVDLAPTVLSLAGVTIPERMQGQAFMGCAAAAPAELQFGFTTNSGDHYVPARSVFDGRFKLVHAYCPHKPACLRNAFQWGMPANLAWDDYVLSGRCTRAEWLAPFRAQAAERLFDMTADPFELCDLAAEPRHAETLKRLRAALSAHLRSTGDLGFFPMAMRDKGPRSLHAWVRETGFPLTDLIATAETASVGDFASRALLASLLKHAQPEFRFWGASGLATLAQKGQGGECPRELFDAMSDPDSTVAAEAALAVCYYGKAGQGLPVLMTLFETEVVKFAALRRDRPELRQAAAFQHNGAAAPYSALETLSLEVRFAAEMRAIVPRLEALHEGYKPDDRSYRQDARSILVNLGRIPVADLFGVATERKGAAR